MRKKLKRIDRSSQGAIKELSTLMVYLAIKEAINIASIQVEHPREYVDVGFIKRTIQLFKATNPSTSEIEVFVDYLKLHRDVLRDSGNTKGAKLINELLTTLTKG